MLKRSNATVLFLFLSALSAAAAHRPKTITLYSPIKYKDESRGSFDFKREQYGTRAGWDLNYGHLYTGDDHDWFQASTGGNNRHVIRDLGTLDWTDHIKVPKLTPQPELAEGARRQITVNTSGGQYERWTKQTEHDGIFTRALVGHMYVLRAKNEHSDYYVLFRVESIERGDHCTITWRLVHSPR